MKKQIIKLMELWASETPKAWKRAQTVCLSLGVSCAAVWGINSFMGLELAPLIITSLKYVIAACAFITGRAQFKAKQDE